MLGLAYIYVQIYICTIWNNLYEKKASDENGFILKHFNELVHSSRIFPSPLVSNRYALIYASIPRKFKSVN